MIIIIDRGNEGGITEFSYETQNEKIHSFVDELLNEKPESIKFMYKQTAQDGRCKAVLKEM